MVIPPVDLHSSPQQPLAGGMACACALVRKCPTGSRQESHIELSSCCGVRAPGRRDSAAHSTAREGFLPLPVPSILDTCRNLQCALTCVRTR